MSATMDTGSSSLRYMLRTINVQRNRLRKTLSNYLTQDPRNVNINILLTNKLTFSRYYTVIQLLSKTGSRKCRTRSILLAFVKPLAIRQQGNVKYSTSQSGCKVSTVYNI